MRKETILLTILCVVSVKSLSQSFNEREIKRLNHLAIQTDLYDLNNVKIKTDFNSILKLNSRRKLNKTFGITLGSISLLTTGIGVLALAVKKEDGMSKAILETLGGFSVGVGVISGGISIALFNISKKRKKERDKLIILYEKIRQKDLTTIRQGN